MKGVVLAKEHQIFLKSFVEPCFKHELERIFFFNNNQRRNRHRILKAIAAFSPPVLVNEGSRVYVAFENRAHGQALHVFERHPDGMLLLGALLYARVSSDQINIVHMALRERCRNDFQILHHIFAELKCAFRQIKGVETIRIQYTNTVLKIHRESKVYSR